jgi:AcrR family transcriptional regulator
LRLYKIRVGGVEHHGNRHGRSEPAREAVLQAADDLLVEKGLAGLTVEGIARAAWVAKQTIYRWWPNKVDILFEAFVTDAEEHFVEADHVDLATDVRDTLAQLATFLTDPEAGAMFRALAGWAQQDAATMTRFRAQVVEPQRARDRAPFLRARRRGHLPRRFDIEAAIDRSTGPVFARVLFDGPPLTPAFLDTLVTAALGGRAQ